MRALTIGGAMVDTIAIVDDVLIESMAMRNAEKTFLLLEQGSKTEASSVSTHCGGGAINAGVGLARLGFEVSVLAKVGGDQRAETIRLHLDSEGISAEELLVSADAPTGASAIIAAHDRNAAVFTFRGANTLLKVGDLKPDLFVTDLVYVSTLSGGSADLLPVIVRQCEGRSMLLVVNPGIRQITSRFQMIRDLLPFIEILAINRLEAEAFVRQAVTELSGSENIVLRRAAAASVAATTSAGDGSASDVARALISGLRDLGARTVLLTDGSRGAYVGNQTETIYCPAIEVSVVSSAGAGDAFASTFSGVFVRTGNYTEALLAATINAASVVTKIDSQSGLLGIAQLYARLADATLHLEIRRWSGAHTAPAG